MKASTAFRDSIKSHLENRAQKDKLFATTYSKPNKNLDDCVIYIINRVKSSGINGFADEEIYSMAVHYYDEDDIVVGKPVNCQVAVNHVVELTDEEKEEARKEAIKRAQNEAFNRVMYKKKPTKVKNNDVKQMSLF